jgi:uncharacterized protein YbjT (DUF2867 family)
MTTAVIGATGHVGSEIVRGLVARGDPVAALVRDPDEGRRAFGEPDGPHIRATRLDDPDDLTEALHGTRTLFIAMGSIGIEGVLQRIAINTAAGISSIEQITRLSVLNTAADSLGINQRPHYSIDEFALSTTVPYSTIRPAIFSLSLLAAAHEVRASRTWTGLADSGQMALIDHRDAAEAGLRVLTDPALWGQSAEAVRALVGGARELYDRQDFNFAGPCGDNGFIEDYTTEVRGMPLGAVHLITFNADGRAQHIAAHYRPLSSLMFFSRLLRERFAGTPYAEHFLAGDAEEG